MGDFLGSALPHRLRRRILDLDLVREVWPRAVAEGLSGRLGRPVGDTNARAVCGQAVPAALERGVLTVLAADAATAAEVERCSGPLRDALLRACGLSGASLRVRVRLRRTNPPGRRAAADGA